MNFELIGPCHLCGDTETATLSWNGNHPYFLCEVCRG
jgi:hypothetical protein